MENFNPQIKQKKNCENCTFGGLRNVDIPPESCKSSMFMDKEIVQ